MYVCGNQRTSVSHSLLIPLKEFLIEPGDDLHRLAAQQALLIILFLISPALSPVLGLQTSVAILGFHMGARNLYSGPYACAGSMLTHPQAISHPLTTSLYSCKIRYSTHLKREKKIAICIPLIM